MKKEITYSIIIPHYTIPKLLKRCLMSIPVRDDLQVIVVDDKSTVDNVEKLKILGLEFDHVEFKYCSINGGGGKARNVGLKYAKGEYVLFADADDFFNFCIYDILDEYKNETSDVVFFNANRVDTETYLSTKRRSTQHRALKRFKKDGNLDAFRYIFGEPWSKLIKRQLIMDNHIKFDELPIHNDTRFSYMVGFYAKQVKFDNRALYCLADRMGSVSKDLSEEKLMIRTRVFAEKNRFMQNHGISYFDYLMISPFCISLKRRNLTLLKDCLAICHKFGFSSATVVKKIIYYLLVNNRISRILGL